jgi:hypothetical protein
MSSNLVQKVFRVPISVSETQYIKIVGDQTNSPPNPFNLSCQWDFIAVSFDPVSGESFGSWFNVSAKELDIWLQEENQ